MTARFLTLTPVAALSDPGKTVNEDRAGATRALAWIIDGATGLAPQRFTPGATDAAWLAEEMHRWLQAAPNGDLPALVAGLQTEIGNRFAALGNGAMSPHLAPSAALAVLRVTEDGGHQHAEAAFLADVVLLLPTPSGIQRWSDERLKPVEIRLHAAMKANPPDGHDFSEDLRAMILENRTLMNIPGGYWVAHPLLPFGHEIQLFRTEIVPGAEIVLASDGFMRLVDIFEEMTDTELYHAVIAGEAGALLTRLRALEAAADSMRDFPRAKRRDDATVLVVRAG